MFGEIVVGVDERGGADALALACALARPGARLTLVHVLTTVPYLPGPGATAHAVASAAGWEGNERSEALELLARTRRELEDRLAGGEIDVECESASAVGQGLHELAERRGADLIVVGSTRRGLFGRVLLGDDTRDTLDGAGSAVAIAPAGYARQRSPMARVGVGYDGGADAEHAVEVAKALAGELGARVAVCSVISVPASRLGPGPLPLAEAIARQAADARERIAALGAVEPYTPYGSAAEELGYFSATVDLLIVGCRGYGPVGRLLHGSTSRSLTRNARCPLLILTHIAAGARGQAELATPAARPS